MDERIYWLGLQILLSGAGRRLWSLIDHFDSPQKVWEAQVKELTGVPGLNHEGVLDFARRRAAVDPVRRVQEMTGAGISYLCYNDPEYPAALRFIHDPPAALFVRGALKITDEMALAVVGSRKPTAYGRLVAEKIAADLAAAGITVVSGLARGIDTAAHRGALAVGGRTVAVLGCGPDVVYPRENSGIMEQIIERGAVVSEFPPGSPPEAWHFPARNRIISGFSKGVLVVEAAEKSGALITADFALEQGRDVMAVPGNVTSSLSKGTNRLIKQGAKLVESAGDIIEELGLNSLFPRTAAAEHPPIKLGSEEEEVLRLLTVEPVLLDELVERSGLSARAVQIALMFLVTKGLASRSAGGKYTCSARKWF